MSSTEQKHYLDEHLDACLLFDTYFGADKTIAKKEMLEDPMSFLYKLFSSGSVKGETLINLSVGSDVSKTFVAADFFKNIILLESSDCCIRAIESWIRNEPGAAEQSHAAEFACSLTGQSNGCKKQEEKARGAIKQVLKWDITKENPLGAVVLPQADCMVIVYHLQR
uniref:Uncharacterized protein n=1 Tax=Xenopus tropicalis TaxID=8364 RepID=A0A803J686_XENTR